MEMDLSKFDVGEFGSWSSSTYVNGEDEPIFKLVPDDEAEHLKSECLIYGGINKSCSFYEYSN